MYWNKQLGAGAVRIDLGLIQLVQYLFEGEKNLVCGQHPPMRSLQFKHNKQHVLVSQRCKYSRMVSYFELDSPYVLSPYSTVDPPEFSSMG